MSILDTTNIPEEQFDAAKSTTRSATKKSTTKKSTTKKSTTRKTSSTSRSSSKKYTKTGIPGLSVRFSWKEFLGITKLKRKFTKKTGIPTTEAGIERKVGKSITDWLKEKLGFGKK
ncbi:MAG: hypothetical protein IKH22_07270 [Prevotella sp.]|jgi:hypothetical protein|nr:hypothetical protein [Prevotella sp.]